jgi:acyl carrier protein phosphodiesterase
MNFLAHLHIADHCQSSLMGNLLGDFVKGNPTGKYPQAVVEGIRLHRFVDSFTDSNVITKNAKLMFSNDNKRFALIALDLFWDHCLVLDWQQYAQCSLDSFCRHAAQQTSHAAFPVPERYQRVVTAMWQGEWIASYAEMDNIAFALTRMSQRSPRMAPLAHCIDDLQRHYPALRELFSQLYPAVLNAAKKNSSATI